MKNFATVIGTLPLLLMGSSSFATSRTATVPGDWYLTPELLSTQSGLNALDMGDESQMERDVQNIFTAYQNGLDQMTVDPSGDRVGPWALAGSTLDFGISIKGIIGGLFGDGESVATAYWKRRGSSNAEDITVGSVPVVAVREDMSRLELEKALDPALRVLQSSVTEKKPGGIKKHLLTTAENFLEVARQLRTAPEGRWRVSQYVMDFGIDAGGKITGIKAGVDLRFRMVWNRSESAAPPTGTPPTSDPLKNLVRFVREIARDLEAITEPVDRGGYKLSKFGVGIGQAVGGEVVVVKGIARTLGRLYFTPDGKGSLAASPEGDVPFQMAVTGDDPALKIALAEEDPCKKTGGIFAPPGNPYDEFSCKVNRKKFRDGMNKAVKMASLFSKMAPKNSQSKWDLYRVRTRFELSVSGKWYMPWLKGLATMDMEFTKPENTQVMAANQAPVMGAPVNPNKNKNNLICDLREDWREMGDFLDSSLKAQVQSQEVALSPSAHAVPDYPDFESWVYRQYQMRVRGTVGLSLHWLLKVEFMPELETVWSSR